MNELEVYNETIDALRKAGVSLLCASPPTGTDARFPRCVLPRKPSGSRGERDEIDVVGIFEHVLILIECKSKLSQSFRSRNRSGENDFEKLLRIAGTWPINDLKDALERISGQPIDNLTDIALFVSVGESDEPKSADNKILILDVSRDNWLDSLIAMLLNTS